MTKSGAKVKTNDDETRDASDFCWKYVFVKLSHSPLT